MATESWFRVPEAFSKPPYEKALNFESVHLGRNWSKNRGNFGGSIEVSCRISLGVKEIRSLLFQTRTNVPSATRTGVTSTPTVETRWDRTPACVHRATSATDNSAMVCAAPLLRNISPFRRICSLSSSRLYRLRVPHAQKAKESGDERTRLRAS